MAPYVTHPKVPTPLTHEPIGFCADQVSHSTVIHWIESLKNKKKKDDILHRKSHWDLSTFWVFFLDRWVVHNLWYNLSTHWLVHNIWDILSIPWLKSTWVNSRVQSTHAYRMNNSPQINLIIFLLLKMWECDRWRFMQSRRA